MTAFQPPFLKFYKKPSQWASFFSSNLHPWSHNNLRGGDCDTQFDWSHIFGAALHFLWKARNEEIFKRVVLSQEDLFHQFWRYFHSHIINREVSTAASLKEPVYPSFIAWKAPNEG